MNRLPTAAYALIALACLLATAVQSEPIEALVATEAWPPALWLDEAPAATPAGGPSLGASGAGPAAR